MFQGTGKKKFEKLLKSMEEKYPGKVRAVVKFNAPLAHLIMAGADVLAVPSRFEPCGLIQLQGMRYGTVYNFHLSIRLFDFIFVQCNAIANANA